MKIGSRKAGRAGGGCIAGAAAIALAVLCSGMAAEEPAPLNNVDVVRMVAAEMPPQRIIERIRASACRFDTDPEILAELKEAGVPQAIIDAMVAKSGAAKRVAVPVPEEAHAPKGAIEITFDDDPNGTPITNSFGAPAVVQDPNGGKEPLRVELAFFVACDYPLHAPDHWQAVSELGESFTRHHLLFFQAATAVAPEKKIRLAFLDHPEQWRLEAEAGAHTAAAGVAARVGGSGKFTPLALKPIKGLVVPADGTVRVTVRLRSRVPRPGRGAESGDEATLPSGDLTNIGSSGKIPGGIRSTIDIVGVAISPSTAPSPPPPPS